MQPVFLSIRDWCARTGMGRTTTYHRISAGELRAVKLGRKTLIDAEHGLAWLRGLPVAEIHMNAGAQPSHPAPVK